MLFKFKFCRPAGSQIGCQDNDLSCQNEGYCEKLMGVPRCICKDGFFGKTCHLYNGGRNASLGLVL